MELLTPEEVAARLKFNRQTIYAMIRRNQIPSIRIGGRIRIPDTVLDAWAAKLAAELRQRYTT